MAETLLKTLHNQAEAARKEAAIARREGDAMREARAVTALHKIRQQYQAILKPDLFNVKTREYNLPTQPITKDRK